MRGTIRWNPMRAYAIFSVVRNLNTPCLYLPRPLRRGPLY